MAEWCAENLRDCKAWKDDGLEMTMTSNEAARLYDSLVRQYVSWSDCEQLGGIDKTLLMMNKAEPDAIMSRVLSLGLEAMGTGHSVRLDSDYGYELQKLLNDAMKRGNNREIMHAKAVHMFAKDKMVAACEQWERILNDSPNDLLAIKFSHDAYFYLGEKHMIRDSIARVLPKWKKDAPCYSYLYGMHAFGLEECAQYDQAEKQARKGLEMNRFDSWATHAVAHCMEMSGRVQEGIQFMESTEDDWEKSFMLACHNYWHTALFYIELQKYNEALDYFGREVGRRSKSGALLDIVDAASLLLRLQMEGVSVGSQWKSLVSLVEPHIHDHILAFNDAHIRMVLEGGDLRETCKIHSDSMNSFISKCDGDNCERTKLFGKQICDAVSDYYKKDYRNVVENLAPIRDEIWKIGGSNAQRDVFTQMLIHSAIASSDINHRILAKAILEERNRTKPNSLLGQRLSKKCA